MMIYHDPDRYRTVSSSHTCAYHEQNPGKAFAGCTCSASIGTEQVSNEEYAARRAARLRAEEDAVLERAAGIRAKRAALAAGSRRAATPKSDAVADESAALKGDAQ